MNETFRLSRIKAPRSTWVTIILLAAVFVVFGLAMAVASPAHSEEMPRYFDGTGLTIANWLLTHLGA